MSWSLHRWVWLLESPLFVGAPPAGSLNRCRLYVPARNIWGALTSETAQGGANGFPDYEGRGKNFRNNARFTYLYPAARVNGSWRAWLPEYVCGEGLVWRREDHATASEAWVSDRQFRRWLIDARPGTAIEADSDTAAEATLRETECVMTHWRAGSPSGSQPVALVGYVFLKDMPVSDLEATKTLFLGGDTRYGLGRLIQVLMEPATPANRIFGRYVDLERDHPIVQSPIVLAHTTAQGRMCGAQEALTGWDVGRQTVLHANGTPLWTPGSRVAEKDGAKRFHIDELGIWRLENEGVAQAPTNGGTIS